MTWATEQREHWIKKYFPYTGDSRDLSDTRSYINTQDQLKKEYAGRVLLELLQNVDDAANKAALNKVIRTEWVTEFVLDKDSLKVMNHGTTFTGDTLMRLCNGADSDKAEDEETTGAKGIGFLGVLNWSDDIRIYSGDFAVSFSKFGVHKVLDTLNKNNNVIFKTLTDTNPHILELISPLSVPFDVDTDKIPPQWSNKKYNKTYDTCIELRLTPDKIQKVKNAFKTFETDEIYSMLFMRRINKVILTDNTGDMSHTIVISTTENNNIKTITIEKTNGDTTHDKFYFFKYNKYNSIAVPCNWDKNKTFYDTPCICLPADKYNLDRLRRFFISLLWRSSICSRPISLGKYQDIALKILKNEIPDNTDLFLPLIYRRVGRGHVNNMTGIFGAKYLGKRTFIFRFPGYEVMIIINTLHSSSPQMMDIHRQQFSNKEALIFDIDYNTPLDYLLVSNLFKCRDNTPGLKRPPDYVPGQIPLPRRTFVLGNGMQNNLHIKSPYIILPKYDT